MSFLQYRTTAVILIVLGILSCQPAKEIEQAEWPSILTPPYNKYRDVYIGKHRIDVDTEKVYGIDFKVVDSLTIDYKITLMDNWINPVETRGLAKFDGSPFLLSTGDTSTVEAWKFVDFNKPETLIIIGLSKVDVTYGKKPRLAQAFKGKEPITPLLFHK